MYLTFLSNPNGPSASYNKAHEGDIFMSIPLIILGIFSIFFGFICKDLFIGLGTGFYSDNAIYIHPTHEITIETEFGVPILFKLLPLFLTISLSIIYIFFAEVYINNIVQFKYSKLGYNIYSLFNLRFYIELYYYYIYNSIFKLGSDTTKILDRGSVEYIGPYGLELSLIYIGKKAARLDSGIVTSYALFILSGLIFYIFIWKMALIEYSTLTILIGLLFI